jgi:predicted O-linked N-acetylglucosamine transferase (SPINDLY family)
MGNALKDLRRLEQSAKCYAQALECNPSHEYLLGMVAYAKQTICDWQGLPELIERTRRGIESQERVVLPFVALCLADEPELQLKAAQIYWGSAHAKIDSDPLPSHPLSSKTSAKIRLAYYSADFYNHATSYLMAQLFELHDRNRFEVLGFSFGGRRDDEMARRVSRSFDAFIDVSDLTDQQVFERSREMGVDVAIDLKGYTKGARPGIFAKRLAPVQVNYLGYPGTMGSRYFDYILADERVLPQALWHLVAEKVACLPHSYQVNDAKREISGANFDRDDLGLPESGFVFCCFNNSYKISQAVFDDWCEIMRRVPSSVLWLMQDSEAAAANLRHQGSLRGIAPERFVFARRMNLPEHLARHKAADLFLDTLPVNAHTTASDALWAGLPLLTREGQSFAGRVAASLLQALGLPELVTQDRQAYIDKAVALATAPERLQAIRSRLEASRLIAPLFDAKRFARNMEDALGQMHERATAGLEPDHIWVKEQS